MGTPRSEDKNEALSKIFHLNFPASKTTVLSWDSASEELKKERKQWGDAKAAGHAADDDDVNVENKKSRLSRTFPLSGTKELAKTD